VLARLHKLYLPMEDDGDEEGEDEDDDEEDEEEGGKDGVVDESWLTDESIEAMVPLAAGSSVFAIVSCMNHR